MVMGGEIQGVGRVELVIHGSLSNPPHVWGGGMSVVVGVVQSLSVLTILSHLALVPAPKRGGGAPHRGPDATLPRCGAGLAEVGLDLTEVRTRR